MIKDDSDHDNNNNNIQNSSPTLIPLSPSPSPSLSHHGPPPRRLIPNKPFPANLSSPPFSPPRDNNGKPTKESWKSWSRRKGASWGEVAVKKGVSWSDAIGGRANGWAERIGSERFWPTTGDAPLEMDKCARILAAFTALPPSSLPPSSLPPPRKVLKKIPSTVIRSARGLAIFTSMRSGIAPLGGAGGAGIVVARLPDGSWSAPCSISPNNLSGGLMLGVDIYDAVLVIRTQSALESFYGHKVTLGTELAVAAGPYGSGAAVELGKERSPVLSYVRSRGFYAGWEAVGQVFVVRSGENEEMYHWPGVRPMDILTGGVPHPHYFATLHQALLDAESGAAQTRIGGPDAEFELIQEIDIVNSLDLEEGEVLRLPPTPDRMAGDWGEEDEVERRRVGDGTAAGEEVAHHHFPSEKESRSGRTTPPTPPRPVRRKPVPSSSNPASPDLATSGSGGVGDAPAPPYEESEEDRERRILERETREEEERKKEEEEEMIKKKEEEKRTA
ncbi:hypothetical protein T439DRAFT_302214 [Meredithblackwellia eburnea MCA 4105]